MKDIYDLLNYVEVDLKEYDETQLDDLERKKFKKKLHHDIKNKRYNFHKISKYVALSLAILTLIGVVTFKTNPTFARSIPILGTLIKSVYGYNNDEFDKYTSVINKTVEKNDLTVTLNEVALDRNNIMVAATFKSNEKFPESSLFATMNPTIFINGKQLISGGGGNKRFTDPYTYVTVDKISIDDNKIPDKMNMKIVYNDFSLLEEGQKEPKIITGPWEFELNITKNQIENKTKIIKVDKYINYKDTDMRIKNITITPLSTTMYFNYNSYNSLDSIDCDPFHFIITDGKGRYLRWEGGSYVPTNKNEHYANKNAPNYFEFSSIPKDIKKLYITPYYLSHNDSKRTEPVIFDGNLPIVLKQNSENKLIINNIRRENGKIYVDYRAEGNCFGPQVMSLYLYDNNKKELDRDGGNLMKVTNSKDMITLVCKDRNPGNIYVGTSDLSGINILKDSEFTIDLKN